MNHKTIEQTNCIKFLGIILDQKFTWEQHIDALSKKLSKACFIIRQLRNTVSLEILKLAYYGLAQSNISYGLMFWGKSTHSNKIFLIQKRIIRCMVGAHPRTSCRQIFSKLSILTLPSLYIFLITINIKKQEYLLVRNNVLHEHNTRNCENLYQPYSRLTIGQNSNIYQGIACFNKFNSLFGTTKDFSNFNNFKNILYTYLAGKAFYSVEEFLYT